MPYPATGLLPWRVELFYDGQWNDITCDVVVRDSVVISRGRKDYSDSAEPSSLSLTLVNTDGKYSPRNPRSPLYGKIGRNTPIRVCFDGVDAESRLMMPGSDGAVVVAPGSVAWNVAGDLDLRADVEPLTWRPVKDRYFVAKYERPNNQRGWAFNLRPDGRLRLRTSTTGVDENEYESTVPMPQGSGRVVVRATLDVDSGANQLTNAGFETGVRSPWGVGNATSTVTSARAHSGSYSAQVTPNGTSERCWINSDFIAVTPGAALAASAWVWLTAASTSASVSVNWFDSARGYLSTSEDLVSVPAGTWTQLANTFTAPAGAAYAQIVPTLAGTPSASNVWYVDDASLRTVQHTISFYTAPSMDGPWTPLGDPVTMSGTTSIYPCIEPIMVGAFERQEGSVFEGAIYSVEVRDGIDGTVLAAPDFTTVDSEIREFQDSAGLIWQLGGGALIASGDDVRFVGEVSEWPSRWEVDTYVEVPITASGIRRRLERATTPTRSPMFRASTNQSTAARTVAYWPMEEGEYATQFASAIGGAPMLVGRIPGYHVRDIDFGRYGDFVASDPLPEFHITSAVGHVPDAPDTGQLRVLALVHVPEDGVAVDTDLLTMACSGTAAEWTLQVRPDGTLRVVVFDRAGVNIYNGGSIGIAVNGKRMLLGMGLVQSGTTIERRVFAYEEGVATGGGSVSTTLNGHTFGHATSVTIGKIGDLGGTAVGHVSVENQPLTNTGSIGVLQFQALSAHAGETAAARLARLAAEEAIPLAITGSTVGATAIGAQGTDTILDLLDEVAEADLGILHETRGAIALQYRTRASLYNQRPYVFDYASGHISDPFEPMDDDSAIANDITVTRRDGSSFRAVAEDGPLSMQSPPDGVGRYEKSDTLSLNADTQTVDQAHWRLHLGTVDETRYPQITVDVHGSPQLADTIRRIDVGDRVHITNLPDHLPTRLADLIVQGYTEESDGIRWRFVFNTTPASPWTVAVPGDDVLGRADTGGSELRFDVDADATTVTVTTTDGPLWVEDPDEFPFDVQFGGEVATVHAVQPGMADTFNRTTATGWGTTTTGQVWEYISPSGAGDFRTESGVGFQNIPTRGVRQFALLPDLEGVRSEAGISMSSPATISGGYLRMGVVGRFLDLDNWGGAWITILASGAVWLDLGGIVGGAGAVWKNHQLATSYTPGSSYRMRVRTDGPTLLVKAWRVGELEPSGWMLRHDQPELDAPGLVGTYTLLEPTWTGPLPVVARFSNFQVANPQRFTLTRGVNGIVKPHAAGTALCLANPARLAL